MTAPAPDNQPKQGGDLRRTRSLSMGLVDLAVQLKNEPETVFDVVIVGSGYGASVAARQLAGLTTTENGVTRRITVCVLERGAEYLPGMFASALSDMPTHVRASIQGSGQVMGNREGLFDLRLGADVSALVANGLGGGSLINAGVLLEPDFSTFESGLPDVVRRDLEGKYLGDAKTLLLGKPLASPNNITLSPDFPEGSYPLKFYRMKDLAGGGELPAAKVNLLLRMLHRMKGVVRGGKASSTLSAIPAEITVALEDQDATAHSVNLKACNGCGDCMTGCNVGAKASLDTNLLAQARRAGAQLVTGASVLSLRRLPDAPSTQAVERWELTVVHTSPALQQREAGPMTVTARRVILAAGTLGSPEILLRSRSDSLLLSSRLGEKFSCNGDNIAAIHRLPQPAHSTADEHQALLERKVGPTITAMIKMPGIEGKGFWIQEFAVPAPLKRLFAETVTTGQALDDLQNADCSRHGKELPHALDPCAVDDDAIEKTLLVGLIGHDSAEGVLQLPLPLRVDGREQHQEGTVNIVWPQARYGAQINSAYERLTKLTSAAFKGTGATVIANPMWRLLPKGLADLVTQPLGPVLTVHPLGGCIMGSNAADGVVNEFGQVFNVAGRSTTSVFEGLVVLDGSIVPGSLGANPSLTIAALALRATEKLKREWKLAERPARTESASPSCRSDQGKARVEDDSLGTRPVAAAARPAATIKPVETTIGVVERLWGHVELQSGTGQPASFLLELTLAYEPVGLRELMKLWGGRTLHVDPKRSFMRLFHSGEYDPQSRRYASDGQRFLSDEERLPHVAFQAELGGTLAFLAREKSSWFARFGCGGRAYLCNRGVRDIFQGVGPRLTGAKPLSSWQPAAEKSFFTLVGGVARLFIDAAKLATRAGEVRRFDYVLTPGKQLNLGGSAIEPHLADLIVKSTLHGEKRLTYSRRGNPWGQLTTLTLTAFEPLTSESKRLLRLDTQYMVQTNLPLIELVMQQNKVDALLDMASFGLFVTRVMLSIHLWSFRKPDEPLRRSVQRLPGSLAGLPPPEVILLPVGYHRKTKQAITVRLARYRPAAQAGSQPLPPLAMIHGYSASGTTFAHPSLKCSAARYFCDRGREVWVIDLRTSAGMPLATEPWSMEEVALVDIPAALLHIKNSSGQRVDVIGHCIGAAMLGMALLTDASQVRNATVQLGIDTWITPEQLGILAAFNGPGGERVPHPVVARVVLSQKGPLLRYTEENIFRAHLMRTLRRWLVPEGYRFEARPNPGVADQLLDRLLASLHYDNADFDVENPRRCKAKTPWTATRHRVDALFGRVFAARNLSEETLNAIDDFFGPVNIDTVSQTIHFVRFNCITNQRGRGEFVTLANLRQRWSGIPTLSIHGAGNGLADVSTQSLLRANFPEAGVALTQKIYPDLEHQDCWIGLGSKTVFDDIEQFLKPDEPPALVAATRPCWHFEPAWIGPRIQREAVGVSIHALSSPRFREAQLLLVPVGAKLDKRCPHATPPLPASPVGDSRNWLSVPLHLSNGELNELTVHGRAGWLALIAYRRDQTTRSESDSTDSRAVTLGTVATFFPAIAAATGAAPDPTGELDAWLAATQLDLGACLIEIATLQRQCRPASERFEFALSSCRYPAGLPDQKLAEAALVRLAARRHALGFTIFCGDQIYADATAGVVDPSRRDERYDLPLETAFRSRSMRQLASAMPIYTLLDDHELVDNWEPLAQPDSRAAKKEALHRRYALNAFFKYQRLASKADLTGDALERRTSEQFEHGGASFFLLDTRSQRQYRQPGYLDAAGLFAPGEQGRLETWLTHPSNPKIRFIVTPSLLLPRRLGALNQDADHLARHDGWEGYPCDLRNLLAFIALNQIANVVFLSGDEHLGCVAHADLSIQVGDKIKKARIVSIHASGLYAPFPFANSKPEDFVAGMDSFSVGAVNCKTSAQFPPAGSLFARLEVSGAGNSVKLGVEFSVDGTFYACANVLSNCAGPCTLRKTGSQFEGAEMPAAAAL